MLTLLAVIGVLVVLFVAAVVATNTDEVLIDVLPDAPDLDLPTTAIQAEDLAALRFSQALRGYRMDEVDGVLERLSTELAARDRRLGALQAELVSARGGRASAPTVQPAVQPAVAAEPVPAEARLPAAPAAEPAPGSPLASFAFPDVAPADPAGPDAPVAPPRPAPET